MLKGYFNQSLAWSHAGTPSKYNETTYTVSTIKGRKEDSVKLIRDNQGTERVSTAQVMTEAVVVVNDLIDGATVIATAEAPLLNGIPLFRKVYL